MNINELIERLRVEGEHETYPPASSAEIDVTEARIGNALPESYKEFVSGFSNGAYLFGVQEVSAVGDGNPQIVPIQDIARLGDARAVEAIPFRNGGETNHRSLVPFSLDANGNEWCFVVAPDRPGNEYEVAYFDTTGRKLYGRLGGFTQWLSVLVSERGKDEVIRIVYEDDEAVLYDELMLG